MILATKETDRRRLAVQRSQVWTSLAFALACLLPSAHGENAASVQRRLAQQTQFLSSDELGGRGLGTAGLDTAADYIAEQFQQLGLKTALFRGQPLQRFEVTIGAELGQQNTFRFERRGGEDDVIDLSIGSDFTPLAIGGDGSFDLPLVFVGYGISAPEANYDDYEGLDVSGKAVIVLRHEPQQNNPHSAFNGNEDSEHAAFRRKLSNAFQHGAAAVVFCTDKVEIEKRLAQWVKRQQVAEQELDQARANLVEVPNDAPAIMGEYEQTVKRLTEQLSNYAQRVEEEHDPVLEFTMAGNGDDARDIPVLHCRRGVMDRLLASSGHADLASIEAQIDQMLQPQSFALENWHAKGSVDIERRQVKVSNVVAVLEGTGQLAEETVVIGAHYDHLGRGGEGSAQPGSTEIHNGADDNASGVAALLEVARMLSARQQPAMRRVVFVAFTGEEKGLLGSAHYARHAPFPLEQTVAMLNFDMVGRLKDNSLIVNGTETAQEFEAWIDSTNSRFGFDITKSPGGFGPSDHSTFYAKQIPVLHFFTGSHSDYHRPSDDFHLLNIEGIRRISEFVVDLALQIATAVHPLTYVEVAQQPIGDSRPNPRPYFGSIPDFANAASGYAISGTGPGSPAARAGLQAGDVIVRLGEFNIGNLEDFDNALRKYTGGDKVEVVVERGEQEVLQHVILDPPR